MYRGKASSPRGHQQEIRRWQHQGEYQLSDLPLAGQERLLLRVVREPRSDPHGASRRLRSDRRGHLLPSSQLFLAGIQPAIEAGVALARLGGPVRGGDASACGSREQRVPGQLQVPVHAGRRDVRALRRALLEPLPTHSALVRLDGLPAGRGDAASSLSCVRGEHSGASDEAYEVARVSVQGSRHAEGHLGQLSAVEVGFATHHRVEQFWGNGAGADAAGTDHHDYEE